MNETLILDIRLAFRRWRLKSVFTTSIVLTMALAIGANTAMFSIVDGVLLKPLPYPQPERLVRLERTFPGLKPVIATSIPIFMIWRNHTQVFQEIAAYDSRLSLMNLTGVDAPLQLKGLHVTASYFPLFGVPLVLGRTFTLGEDQPGGPLVAVISEGLWRSQFGGNQNVLGKIVEINGEPHAVIGVVSNRFRGEIPTDVWVPLKADPSSTDQGGYLLATARLKRGISLEEAQASMGLAAEEYRRAFPGMIRAPASFTAQPLSETLTSNIRPSLVLLSGAVLCLLLIACVNCANLLSTQIVAREREFAIRNALGGSAKRLIRQLMIESCILCLAGGTLGLVLGEIVVRSFLALVPTAISGNGVDLTLDWRVLTFTVMVSMATGILFGIIPATEALRVDVRATLNESGLRSSSGIRHERIRSILVVAEITLTIVLLAATGLLIRTYLSLRRVNLGFDPQNIISMDVSLNNPRFEKTVEVTRLVRETQRSVVSLPAVIAVSIATSLPLERSLGLPFTIKGRPLTSGPYHGAVDWVGVSPEYFKVFRIPLLRGRVFDDNDGASAGPVVVINEAMAKQFWLNADPIGSFIAIGRGVGPQYLEPDRQIVGVVGNIRNEALSRIPGPTVYVPIMQLEDRLTSFYISRFPLTWVIRTRSQDSRSLASEIRRQLSVASGELPIGNIRSVDQVIIDSAAGNKLSAMLTCAFAGAAIILTGIGIYGLISYSVQQRYAEIGIRMALGASPQHISRMLMLRGMRLVIIGVLAGTGIALLFGHLLDAFVYGVKTYDPFVFTLTVLLVVANAFVAIYLPVRSAILLDPLTAIHYE